MCMKNVNLTIVTADVLGNKNKKSISLGDIDKSCNYEIENKQRVIKSLSLAMFMQAIQSKDIENVESINPDEKLLFSERYAIKIRLTESKSGKAIDLDEFTLCPNDTVFKECVCCDTFKYTRLCIYDDIVLPPETDNEFFVVKILIKHLTENSVEDSQKAWTVQTVYPITLSK